jgi:hypothetical protein
VRKHVIDSSPAGTSSTGDSNWLDLESLADVEVTSEAPAHPIESIFSLKSPAPWKAAAPGPQTVRLLFHEPQRIARIYLQFSETNVERTQEFSLHYGQSSGDVHELRRQQWTFSPNGSTTEVENYEVSLTDVTRLELTIDPDRNRKAVATLDLWKVA